MTKDRHPCFEELQRLRYDRKSTLPAGEERHTER